MPHRSTAVLAALLLATSGCTPGLNYLEAGPRYTGGQPPLVRHASYSSAPGRHGLRLVTFNVKYGEQVDSAISVLRHTPELQSPDVVALQEVDAAGAERIAAALGLRYVYYPATFHPKYDRDFGNAILTAWPIVDDSKILLPHWGRFRKTARTATAASLLIGSDTVRVYSAHLGTMAEISPRDKREQAAALLADATQHRVVAILGDMNCYGIGHAFTAAGFDWVTDKNPKTFAIGRWDHVFLKGLSLAHDSATGVIRNTRKASDHRPVWVVGTLERGNMGKSAN